MFFYWLAMVSIFILHLYCMSYLEIANLKDVYYLLLSTKKDGAITFHIGVNPRLDIPRNSPKEA